MYKTIISAWLNDSKDKTGSKYLSVKNVSERPIVIEPGQSLFLNMTPKHITEKNANVPMFSKSVKVEEEQEYDSKEVADDVPF